MGDLSGVGEFISTLVSSSPFEARVRLDGKTLHATAYVILIVNMPFVGANIQIHPEVSFNDGKLDVFVFTDLSKINLISYAIRSLAGNAQDESVKHYRAKQILIEPHPHVAIIADGLQLTDDKLSVRIKPRALSVIASK